jgi:hypothetical protein
MRNCVLDWIASKNDRKLIKEKTGRKRPVSKTGAAKTYLPTNS